VPSLEAVTLFIQEADMQEIERQFDYNEGSAGMLRLLGVLMMIMAPLTMWMTFQEASPGEGLLLFARGWFAFIPEPLVPWVMRILSLVLIWAGYLIIKGAGQQQKYGGRIAFTPTGLIFEAGPPDGSSNEIPYPDISNGRISDRKEPKSVTFKREGG